MVFGRQALEDPAPAGLTRMTKEDWPDQWPPVLDEVAAPVEGDEGALCARAKGEGLRFAC